MIGIYDYTVILTYMSVISGFLGIVTCLHGMGHPYFGVFFLLFAGLCDTFDGKVARTKKNRSSMAKGFGVQIDSLADIISFGILPACIGISIVKVSQKYTEVPIFFTASPSDKKVLYPIIFSAIACWYVLTGLIRLAYFNVTEEERRKTEKGETNTYYTGLPITMAALIFPTVLLFQFALKRDLTVIYFIVMLITSFLFVSKIQVKKPGMKTILVLIAIGAIEFIVILGLFKFRLFIL